MQKFSGGEDESKKDNLKGGDIFLDIVDQNKVQENLPYFAFYRALSKHWHYCSMGRKEDRLMRKREASLKELDNLTVQNDAHMKEA